MTDATSTGPSFADTPRSQGRRIRLRTVLGAALIAVIAGSGGYALGRADRGLTVAGTPTDTPSTSDIPLALDATGLISAALEAYGVGDFDTADEAYRAALDLDPENLTALYNLAQLLQIRGDVTAAQVYYRRALMLDPGFHSARYNLALALQSAGDEDGAIVELRYIVDADPDSVGALYTLGNVLIARGEAEEGGNLVARAIELDPSLLDTSQAATGD